MRNSLRWHIAVDNKVRKTYIIKIHECASTATQANLLQPPDDYQTLHFLCVEVMRQILITQSKMAWILAHIRPLI